MRYQHGAATYLEVLDAERELFSIEHALVQTRRVYLTSSIKLYTTQCDGGDTPGEVIGANGKVLNLLDFSDVYMVFSCRRQS